jgi:ethanolamine utilization protein EutQ
MRMAEPPLSSMISDRHMVAVAARIEGPSRCGRYRAAPIPLLRCTYRLGARWSETSMSETLHFKAADMTFETFGGPPGTASIARLVTDTTSKTMGAGVITFDGCSIEWTVLYDEAVVVLEGVVRLRTGDGYRQVIEAKPGDVIWIPENTSFKYEGERAKIFYAVYPVDWKKRHGL